MKEYLNIWSSDSYGSYGRRHTIKLTTLIVRIQVQYAECGEGVWTESSSIERRANEMRTERVP